MNHSTFSLELPERVPSWQSFGIRGGISSHSSPLPGQSRIWHKGSWRGSEDASEPWDTAWRGWAGGQVQFCSEQLFCQPHGPQSTHGSTSTSSRQSSLQALLLPTAGKGNFIKIKPSPTLKSHLAPDVLVVAPPRFQPHVSRRNPAAQPQLSCFPWPGWDPSQGIF